MIIVAVEGGRDSPRRYCRVNMADVVTVGEESGATHNGSAINVAKERRQEEDDLSELLHTESCSVLLLEGKSYY